MNPLYISWATHFLAFGSTLFFIALSLRSLFIYRESYNLTIQLTVVIITFGGNLVMTHYPDVFMIHWANIGFSVGGAVVGVLFANAWAGHRQKMLRQARSTKSIMERYKDGPSKEDIVEAVTES